MRMLVVFENRQSVFPGDGSSFKAIVPSHHALTLHAYASQLQIPTVPKGIQKREMKRIYI